MADLDDFAHQFDRRALGQTLELTISNIPALDGTLVVIDTSGSMLWPVSGRSTVRRVEVAAVLTMATAKRSTDVDVVIYGQTNARPRKLTGRSVLGGVEQVVRSVGSVGHATYGHTAISRWFDPKHHRRVVMFTDDQQHDSGHVRLDHVPLIYTFNLAGYGPSALPAGERGRYTIGGFTDATFTALKVLEEGHNARGRSEPQGRAAAHQRPRDVPAAWPQQTIRLDRRSGLCRRIRITSACIRDPRPK